MNHPPGQIVTFYSYKGGTGRTMALANVAWILASNGKNVLVADWDLESPGLHRFFRTFLNSETVLGTAGVIDMIRKYQWQASMTQSLDGGLIERPDNWHAAYAKTAHYAFSLQWDFNGGRLDFLTAGRQNGEYSEYLAGMQWDAFYNHLEGATFLDALRDDMKRNYDYVLIDSRTGLSDVADICTIHLPDVVVDCFTLSEQGIEGAAGVAHTIRHKYRARKIRVLPVPMRVDPAEKEKADAGRAFAMRRFAGLPAGMTDGERLRYWTSVEVPYQAFYAYEETLACFGDLPGAVNSLLAAFEKLTEHITEGEATSLAPMDEALRRREKEKFRRRVDVSDEEISLWHSPEDDVWAEWIESLLTASGVRVSDPRQPAPPGGQTLAIVSSASAEQVPTQTDENWSSGLVAVYVSDIRPLSTIPMNRTTVIAGLSAEAAAERILRLINRSPDPDAMPIGPRFPGHEPGVSNAPARNPRFTGRDEELRQLRAQLRSGGTTVVLPVVALQGMGGVGKTQLALEYVHRYRRAYDVVWWILSDDPRYLDTHLSDLAAPMDLEKGSTAVENRNLVLNALSSGRPTDRWLLVYDNADDMANVAPLLPKGGRGHTLITSRTPAWSDQAHAIEVNVFRREESITHLRRRLAETITAAEAKQVAEALGDLPIAISAAEAWLVDTGTPVADYLRQIHEGGAGTDALERIYRLSLERLAIDSPGAFRLLQLCSVMAAETALELIYSDDMADVLVRFDPHVSDRTMRGSLVQRLNRLALVRLDGSRKQMVVHRLLQRVVRDRMTEDELRQARHDVHLVLAASRPGGDVSDAQTWPQFQLLWPHMEISEALRCDDEKMRELIIDRVRYLGLRGDLSQGEELGTRIAADWSALLADTDDPVLRRQWLYLRFNLANILRAMGRFRDALDMDQEVLAAQQNLLGPEHAHTLMTAGGLAGDLRGLGRYEEALVMDRGTYDAWTEMLGDNQHRTLVAAHNLAISFRLMGDFRAARKFDENTYAIRQQVLSANHPYTFGSATGLGRDLRDAGEYERSAALLSTVYEQIRAARGIDSVEAAIAHTNLAVSLRALGRAPEAMPILEAAYKRLDSALGPTNPETLACRLSRAMNLLAIGENSQADREMRAVIHGYTELLGSNHPHVLISMSNQSAVLRATGDRKAARELAQTAAEQLSEILTADHPFTVGARMNQAICLAELNELDQARLLSEDALRRLVSTFGSEHPDTLRAQANLALLLRAHGEGGEDAQPETPIRRLIELLGAQHPSVRALQQGTFAHRIIEPHPF
ncbi:MAG TPA: FxSxx-COOH system tetratricopeptide repeat protein [Candidatus Limnocylindrales bacterium]|nr:FxSxx-COOH system tetratricopeptide repeat protein [Candidatus Limnocylindrales bacterium]